jgi:ATP:ADP antiporter, AAA family
MPGPLQRLLDVRRHEIVPVLASGFFFFCVLTALMVVRPAREALGMQRGIEAIRWLFVGTAVVTLALNPVFGLLVSRFRRMTFIAATYLSFAAMLVGFHALLVVSPRSVGEVTGQVFYVWFSVFNLFATMVFWAVMADRFSLEQAKRLFGVVAVGGTLGAICGPWLASILARPLGTPALLSVSAGFLLLAVGAARIVTGSRRAPAPEPDGSGRAPEDERAAIGGSAWEGLRSAVRSPYLLGISGYVLVLTVLATFLYFTRLQMVAALGEDLDLRTTVFARIDVAVQVTTLVLQGLVTGRLMQRLGVPFALALLPLVSVLGFAGLALAGTLAVLVAFDAAFRAVQRAVLRPARETLFTVVSREDRYKSKAFIDTFVYRGGDVLGAQTEGLLARLAAGTAPLALVAVPLALAWGALGVWLGRAQRRRSPPVPGPSTLLPGVPT